MNLNLREMDAAEMCDVLHFFFEEDNRFSTGEEAEALSRFRSSFYRMYNKTYAYGVSSESNTGRQYISNDGTDIDDPLGSGQKVTKGYIPPTKFNGSSSAPFGATLDPPIGG